MYNDYPTIYESNINQYFIYYIILAGVVLAIFVLTLISLAKIFKKANRSGISAIIPFYNFLVLLEITNLPKWYFILLLIPGVNIIFEVFIMTQLARLFRKSKFFGLGLTFLPFIFYPVLAFDDSEYLGLDLVAMENKSMVVEVPKIVNKEDNPVVNENFDDKNKNINISIGGGVYQKDYTNTLLRLDEKQVIVDNDANTENIVVVKPQNSIFVSSIPEENKNNDIFKDVATTNQVSFDNNNFNSNQSYIELMTNNVTYEEESVGNTNQNINNFQNQASEYVNCPQCGATIKRSAGVCFLCGKKLD